ncbi:MAG: FKBP-type peptidyl-prolyl cis-trans isomerase [Polymorphobacter sp.]|uniref:FKBP-type peptidyl-prolyl cis-trans isomerase n=1 Tax=Polymorphobacter sp. TaxID=1909290 RepID=UPI003A8A4808
MKRVVAGLAAALMLMGAVGVPVVMPGGTRVTDRAEGKGAMAEPGRMVAVHYTGWVWSQGLKGKQFDSSVGGAPFVFMLGAGEVIFGWDEGVAGMRVGGKRTLLVPASAGYGAMGAGPDIPPNATLLFEVELVDVR